MKLTHTHTDTHTEEKKKTDKDNNTRQKKKNQKLNLDHRRTKRGSLHANSQLANLPEQKTFFTILKVHTLGRICHVLLTALMCNVYILWLQKKTSYFGAGNIAVALFVLAFQKNETRRARKNVNFGLIC